MTSAINIEGLSKSYARRRGGAFALRDLSLAVTPGEILALLGANGAGKSTLLRILSTLLIPDAGRATVADLDVTRQANRVREIIGVALQDASVHPSGRVRQTLTLHARLHGLDRRASSKRSGEVLELMGLGQVSSRKASQLSGGMRRRLDLGLALIHQPPVLLLDEPTASLDPISRNELWSELARLRDNGTCVLLATQDMQEARCRADRVVVLVNGAVWLDDEPSAALDEISVDRHVA